MCVTVHGFLCFYTEPHKSVMKPCEHPGRIAAANRNKSAVLPSTSWMDVVGWGGRRNNGGRSPFFFYVHVPLFIVFITTILQRADTFTVSISRCIFGPRRTCTAYDVAACLEKRPRETNRFAGSGISRKKIRHVLSKSRPSVSAVPVSAETFWRRENPLITVQR